MAPRRTLVVGDVHGCLSELDELLAALAPVPGQDRLVFLGDLLDRGPDPVGVVRRVRALGAECLLGNHEEKHLRWASAEARARAEPGFRNPLRPFDPKRAAEHAALGPEDLAWLAGLPRVLDLGGGFVAVHGGFIPGRPIARQPLDWLVKLRWVDRGNKPVSRERGGDAGVSRWAARWTGPESVVYGHHAREEVVVDAPAPGVRCIGIDTGCVYGGRLTALVLPGEALVQVVSHTRRERVPEED